MSKDTTQRHQSVAELLTELRALHSGLDAATVEAPTKADVPSIAVLPFRNMSADPEQEYFCEGMAEEIINALTSLEGLHVASRTSAFKARDYDIAEVGAVRRITGLLGSVPSYRQGKMICARCRLDRQSIAYGQEPPLPDSVEPVQYP